MVGHRVRNPLIGAWALLVDMASDGVPTVRDCRNPSPLALHSWLDRSDGWMRCAGSLG
jgi:hypothetical protein